MTTKTKMVILSLVLGLPAAGLGRLIWPDAPGLHQPTGAQMPFFALVALVEGVSFGLGVAFALYGWPMLKQITGSDKKITTWTYFSLIWLLVSWWPHDNLHRHIGEDIQKLLYIEIGFHVTVLAASWVVASYFWRALKKESQPVQS